MLGWSLYNTLCRLQQAHGSLVVLSSTAVVCAGQQPSEKSFCPWALRLGNHVPLSHDSGLKPKQCFRVKGQAIALAAVLLHQRALLAHGHIIQKPCKCLPLFTARCHLSSRSETAAFLFFSPDKSLRWSLLCDIPWLSTAKISTWQADPYHGLAGCSLYMATPRVERNVTLSKARTILAHSLGAFSRKSGCLVLKHILLRCSPSIAVCSSIGECPQWTPSAVLGPFLLLTQHLKTDVRTIHCFHYGLPSS